MDDAELLALHRSLVAIPSVSHQEGPIVDWLEAWFRGRDLSVERIGLNLFVRTGEGPRLLFDSHLDTVPPTSAWTRPPHRADLLDGRVYGLGSNDAKGCVAAMIAAFCRVRQRSLPLELCLLLVPEEETGGQGTEHAWPILRARGDVPLGVIVGEPTSLEVAVAQSGLLILQLEATGDPCHAAHARRLHARNPIVQLAQDLVAVRQLDLGPPHPTLGLSTLEPTVISGGQASNQVPASATCVLDLRTVPGVDHGEFTRRVQGVVGSRVTLRSGRLRPCACPDDALLLTALRSMSQPPTLMASPTMSDLVFFDTVAAVKVGPGDTRRSHRADEFLMVEELLSGARFYENLAESFAITTAERGGHDVATLGQG